MMVVIAGGGTGGHLFPGLAVAEEFKRRNEKTDAMFIGTESGLEAAVIPREGYPIRLLRTEGVLGKSPLRMVLSLYRALRAVSASLSIYKHARPDLVVGTGGYVSFGPVVAARLKDIPVLLLEQNVVPGLANRVLARLATCVAVTYHESVAYFPRQKTHRTGNPVRRSVLQGNREAGLGLFGLDPKRSTVLILGGSSGAKRINEAAISALNMMLELRETVQFLHQTGQQDYERVRKAYREMGYKAMVSPFIHQMPEAYAVADVVISRAGATTLAEVTALGKPVILVPYPHAGAHQEFNARKLYENGGCRLVRDHELDGETLSANLKELLGSEQIRGEMRRQCRALGRADAAERVVDLAYTLLKDRGIYV